MRRVDELWKSVDEKVEAIRLAQEATARAEGALLILRRPEIEGHFKEKFRQIIEVMLTCQDSELVRWRANAAALIDFYTSLVSAVAAGEVAGKRLAELDSKKEE